MFLIANAHPEPLEPELEAVEGWLNGTGVKILVIERGLQQTRNFQKNKPEGVEHFGYVDGRSQPLFLAEDIDQEGVPPEPPATTDPRQHVHWNPAFKPSQFITPDPNGKTPVSAGSFFVFRKLEQNVRGFNQAEETLGKQIFGAAANQDQLDRAGAMVVGRFEDGTPLVLSAKGLVQNVVNDFTYAGDPSGLKCPFHSHIRKVNPRNDIERILDITDETGGRKPIMARRGITYGALRPHNADQSEFADAGHEPEKDVGLLFMAYMASIENQFEFTQKSWANNPAFVSNINPAKNFPPNGIDPIIGQTNNAAAQKHTYTDGWTPGAVSQELSFDKFVTLQGGEYFFAPSLSFLRGVGL
jgi:Dyp-type peroxidase family